MSIFRGYNLERHTDDYVLILYVNTNSVELSTELGEIIKKNSQDLKEYVQKIIEDKFPNIKISSAKIMLGTMLLATIPLGMDALGTKAKASITTSQQIPEFYTVKSGDTLWKISQTFGVSIDKIKSLNDLKTDTIYVGQTLRLREEIKESLTYYDTYTVKSGDTLWKIAQTFGISVSQLKTLNNMTTDTIYPGQILKVKENIVYGSFYTVKSGDTLWKIAQSFMVSVDEIKRLNNLTTDIINVGQRLFIPEKNVEEVKPPTITPTPVYEWPAVTYVVQPGDTVYSVAKKFNTTVDNILRYNYMSPDDWLDAGDKIAISGYAPRVYTVTPGEATYPSTRGKIVDWFLEGQYIIKRGDIFTIVDVQTGKQFKVKMMGGYNHSDVEPLTVEDTEVMRSLFGTWQWNPRPVVIYKDGMNIAASLSGMPHSAQTITNNGVTGHFDLYLKNSLPHSQDTSNEYVEAHYRNINTAAGL
ncbi:LysM peptidoglycan-binding domain-containing protein [Caloramator sp. ALD01]|uniref:LysM peptidoglycan-binding domain-containing protein n=1 Tax=Caloramator sp. ALD01 TaxID=1031288 RepID=UPI000408D9D4|nr:LysM peptidoglycan-binding domain-containing protein [Caloramator sp. ALD01]